MKYGAHRLDHLQESIIRSITRYGIEKGAVLLAQGFPDFDPPEEVLAAAERALRQGLNQYAPTWGLPELRKAIAEKSSRFYGQKIDPDREITVTCGVTEAIFAAMLGIVNPGERVIVFEPAHEQFYPSIVFAGAVPVWIPLRPPEFRFDNDQLEAAFKSGVKAIILNSPHNPSGRVFTSQELSSIARLCLEYNAVAICDEIYEHLVYDGRTHIPLATLPGMVDRTITICGFGKTFAITGWRLGYAIASESLTNVLRKVHDFTTVCAPTPLQAAMVTALNMPDSYYDSLREFYLTRRNRMIRTLRDSGFECQPPEGAYYVMADFRALGRGDNDLKFAYWLIDQIGVATVPGSSFFASNSSLGRGFIRFAFPKRDQTLGIVEERLSRLRSDHL